MNKIIHGNSLEVLKTFENNSINCCITSPPYYGLRDYGADGQIGLEETPEEYINKLVAVFEEVRRVLTNDGTCWIVIGDSYANSGKGAASYPDNAKKYLQGTNKGLLGAKKVNVKIPSNCKPKDLIGIPWMLAFALRNAGWYLRQDIIWAKPNPMPESVRDRCTKSHEYIFLLSKSKSYYYNQEAIKEPTVWKVGSRESKKQGEFKGKYNAHNFKHISDTFRAIKDFRNKRDVWTIPTNQFKGAHFATYPIALIEPCILAGCPENGIVLDPFFGSGTTGKASIKNNRKFIGIDINSSYIEMAKKRLESIQGVLI